MVSYARRLSVVLAGTVGGVAGGAWLSGAVLVLFGPDVQVIDIGIAFVSLAILVLIGRIVSRAGGLRWLLAFVLAAIYGAALVPLILAQFS